MTLVGIVDNLRDRIATLGVLTAEKSRSLEDIMREHVPIRDAIRMQDPDQGRTAMAAHLEHTQQLLVAGVVGQVDGDVPRPRKASPNARGKVPVRDVERRL